MGIVTHPGTAAASNPGGISEPGKTELDGALAVCCVPRARLAFNAGAGAAGLCVCVCARESPPDIRRRCWFIV